MGWRWATRAGGGARPGGGRTAGAASALALGVLLGAAAASAAPLTSGQISFQIVGPDPSSAQVVGGGTDVSGFATSPGLVTLGCGSGFAGHVSLVDAALSSFAVGPNQAGTFSGSPIGGAVSFLAAFGFVGADPTFTRTVSLPVGVTATVTEIFTTVQFGTGTTRVEVVVAPWTAGTVTFPTGTTAMGANGLGPAGAGSLNLVSPVRITEEFSSGFTQERNVVMSLDLAFVPEPGTLVPLTTGLLGAGLLVGLPRRR